MKGKRGEYYAHPTAVIDGVEVTAAGGARAAADPNIGKGTAIWHFCHVMKGAKIGCDCSLGQNVFVASTAVIGNRVKIQNNVSVYDGVVLQDDVFVGPSAVFTNVMNPRAHVDRKNEFKRTVVHEGATIGANATIVCGNEIGRYAFVAAGAVVTRDIDPFELVGGVPAKNLGYVCRCGERLPGVTRGRIECRECGLGYVVTLGRVTQPAEKS